MAASFRMTRPYSRRMVLAVSASTAATAALAACGGSTVAPTNTPAPAATPTAAGPAATATVVPQSLGGTSAPTVVGSAATKPVNLADKQIFRLAGQEPASTDPAVTPQPWMTSQLFEGLITLNQKDGTFEPAMAESYSGNQDATVWTFKIRPNMKWSDGAPLGAQDFEYSWKRIPDPKTSSQYTAAVLPIKNGLEITKGQVPPDQLGVKALDDRTFQVTLTTPTPFFPLLASTWSFYPVPRHIIEKAGDKWLEAGNLVSNGPYVLKEWKHDQLMAFEINPTYWGPKPTITRAEWVLYDDPISRGLSAYENNELDHAVVPSGGLERVRNDPKLSREAKGFPESRTQMIHFDATNKPTDDIRVRQALSLAIDRDTLANVILKKTVPATSTILPPDIPGYNPAAALPGNLDKAKQLMAGAGFPNGQGWPTEFSIIYSTNATYKLVAEYVQDQWKKNLGISSQIQVLEPKAYAEWRRSTTTKPFNAFINAWGSDYGDPYNWHNFLFSSDTDFYHTHWKNPQFDMIVANAAKITDTAARTKEYEKAEVILINDAAHVPMYNNQVFYIFKPSVQGVYHRPILGEVPWFKYLSITKT